MNAIENAVQYSVASATIAGELYKAGQVANQLSLVSKNSKAMVLRAGSQAAGLRVLSDFFADLAVTTIDLSKEINANAVLVANACVALWRNETYQAHLRRITDDPSMSEAIHHQVELCRNHAAHDTEKDLKVLRQALRKLRFYLDDIEQQTQASNVVAVNFRLEATQTGTFQPLLNAMAEKIDQLTNLIKEHIKASQKQLSAIRG